MIWLFLFACALDVIVNPVLSAVVLMEDDTEDSNPWDLPELQDTGVPWSGEDWRSSLSSDI